MQGETKSGLDHGAVAWMVEHIIDGDPIYLECFRSQVRLERYRALGDPYRITPLYAAPPPAPPAVAPSEGERDEAGRVAWSQLLGDFEHRVRMHTRVEMLLSLGADNEENLLGWADLLAESRAEIASALSRSEDPR